MTTSDARDTDPGDADQTERRGALELLTDDGEEWTAVPESAAGRERATRWITVEKSTLCDLEEWR